jgi:hypothetical protein
MAPTIPPATSALRSLERGAPSETAEINEGATFVRTG